MSDPGGDPGTPRTAPPPAAPRPPAPPPPPPPPAADALAADPVPPRRWRRPATVARSAAPRRGTVALPSVVAGLGLALSLPPFGFWPLAFPSAGLLWWRLGGLGPARRLWAGWLAGMGCFVPGLWWAHAFSLVGAVALMAIEALTWGLACVVVPRWGAGARLCAFPAAMTLAEAFRQAWPFGGLPIGGVFLGQAAGPVVGVARLGGPLLLTWVVFAAGAGLAALVESGVRAWWEARATAAAIAEGAPPGVAVRGPRAPAPIRLLVTGGVTLIVAGTLVVAAAHAPDGGAATGTVRAAAVQGGGVRGLDKSQVDPATVLAAQVAATARVTTDPGPAPSLVLWPEDVVSLPYALDGSPEEAMLAALARHLRATLVVGVTESVTPATFRNEVVAFGPDGVITDRYEKVHRVPFGEYVPYRGFFRHLANLSAVPQDAIPGTGTGLLSTPVAPLGAMVSFEVFFATRGRAAVRAGATLLVVPTNTSSYATAQIPTQEIAASEIQAVAQGRDLLQAAPTGYSAAITNRGVLLTRSVLGAPQVVTVTLHTRTGRTLYVRFGDLPVVLAALALVLLGWWLAAVGGPVHRGRMLA